VQSKLASLLAGSTRSVRTRMFLAADNDKMIDKMAAMAQILRDLLASVVNYQGLLDPFSISTL
jgi:hypothetical protein